MYTIETKIIKPFIPPVNLGAVKHSIVNTTKISSNPLFDLQLVHKCV